MKMYFKALAGFVLMAVVWIIQGTANASNPANPKPVIQSSADTQNVTVYITRSGSKYHSAGCRSLAKGSKAVTLKEALAKGLSPCSVCKPPKAESPVKSSGAALSSVSPAPKTVAPASGEEVTVYVTRTGAKYHRAGCRYLARSSIPMPLKDAAARYGPCSVCKPPVP